MQFRHTSTINGISALSVASIAMCILSTAVVANDGESAFKARCGNCHGPRDIQFWGRQRAEAAARQAWLEQFLRKHYPPPEGERAPIIDYIQSTIAEKLAPR